MFAFIHIAQIHQPKLLQFSTDIFIAVKEYAQSITIKTNHFKVAISVIGYILHETVFPPHTTLLLKLKVENSY